MDSSQLTRKRAAAATLYAARQNPVDADMVTRNNRLKAAAQAFVAPYSQSNYMNAPCCPPGRTGGAASDYGDSRLDETSFTGTAINTFTNVMDRRAGAAICCGPPPATTLPQGVQLYGDCCCASAPDAPIITSIIPGFSSLIVEFIAPIVYGDNPVLYYQYSLDNGVTFKNIVAVDSLLTITGLSNETSYQIIIRAVNACGSGSNSNMMLGTPFVYMIMNITTTAPNQIMSLPFTGLGAVGVTVDWGDGTTQTYTTTTIQRTYASAGNYTIRIRGLANSYGNINGYTGADKIISVTQWGSPVLTSLAGAFRSATKLIALPSDLPLNVTNTSSMFYNATAFNQDISGWDVSKVTTMQNMFLGATVFNNGGQPLNWGTKTGSVTTMNSMFYNAIAFNQDVSSWDVSKVTIMSYMFSSATAFNNGGQPLNWGTKTGSVTTMTSIFSGTIAFNQDISGWDVSKVITMNNMFIGATAFNNGGQPLNWGTKTGSVTTMDSMFYSAIAFNQDISDWDVSKVTTMYSMFYGATAFNQFLISWTPSLLTNVTNMFCLCPNMSNPANNNKYPQKIKDLIAAGKNVNC